MQNLELLVFYANSSIGLFQQNLYTFWCKNYSLIKIENFGSYSALLTVISMLSTKNIEKGILHDEK